MKNKVLTTGFQLIFFFIFFITINLSAQFQDRGKDPKTGKYIVVRGERPPIDLDQVSQEAYEPGRINIKLNREFENLLPATKLSAGSDGYVVIGNSKLDRINQEFGVKSYKPLFEPLYDIYEKAEDFRERHKAWGLHLWFTVEIEIKSDVIAAVRQFANLKEIEIAEPEYKKALSVIETTPYLSTPIQTDNPKGTTDWTPNDPQFNDQWHYKNTGQQGGTPGADISLVDAWEIEKGNAQVIVAVIDGGIDYFHTDIAANMWSEIGYNFYNNTPNITPLDHGTHVAGTISAVNNNAIGVSGIAGGSGNGDGVRLMSCQVFSSNTSGSGFELAFIYAADNGAAIAQNSWGYTNPNYYEQSLLDAIDYFNLNGGGNAMDGGISIFAAGNDNSSQNYYPGYYSGTLSVAGTNNQDKKSWYSNYGSWVKISAPGGETNTVLQRGVLSTTIGNQYGYLQGTSMACPHVSGVAALVISQAYGLLNSVEVEEILINNIDDHYGVNPTYIGQLGSGRLNAFKALNAVQNVISAVKNPKNFNATPIGFNIISLSWEKNDDNNNVMIAWSSDGIFGKPQNGISYSIGQTLPGGGTVIYSGNNTSFTHSNLNHSTTYYYKACSFNGLSEYSSGVLANATTLCAPVSELPFEESFTQFITLPNCWEIIDNKSNGQVWSIGTVPSGLSGSFGNYAYVNSDGYGFFGSQNTDLITPEFDFTNYTDVKLSFNHFYKHYSSSASVDYSIDNGNTWTNLQTWTASTTNPTTFDQTISAIAGESQVKFRWKYIGAWSYYWCVDDISITGTWNGPIIDFTANPTEVYPAETVTFTDASSNGSFTSWSWDFGEGAIPATVTGQGPHEVIYQSYGKKTVSLKVDNHPIKTKAEYINVVKQIFSASETYTNGDIPTDKDFTSLPGASSCPGYLTVNIPLGAEINGVDVSYNMTASSTGRKSHQRSQLRCVSPGGTNETSLAVGMGSSIGTQSYNRTQLNIANEVAGGGEIAFELHAGRTTAGSGCNSFFNKVDNNSWTITVYYTLNPFYQADFAADKNSICEEEQVQFTDLSSGAPTAWEWEFPGGTPSYSNLQNPVITYNDEGIYNVTLKVFYGSIIRELVKSDFIEVINCNTNILPPGWDIINTGNTDLITIPENAILTIEGEALAENNWLGVFYTNDNDELRCGGAIQVIPGQLNTLTAFGDDPVTNEKDGFDFGETYIWKLYDTEAETEYPAFAFYNPEMANKNGVYGIGICEVEKLGSIQTIQVNLPESWSGFSLPFDPLEQDLSLIFENIEDKLIVLKNNDYLYWPGQNINTFTNWSAYYGAEIKMSQSALLDISGVLFSKTIDLINGWNYLPVLSQSPILTSDIYTALNEKVEIIKEIAGYNIYWNDMNIFTLDQLQPGKAYMIKLKQPAQLEFSFQ